MEIGRGFAAAELRGSENNDPFYYDGATVKTITNNHGGLLGGLTSGMPLILRTAFKPTSSIGKPQHTVDLQKQENTELVVQGRHDACIVPRTLPVIESCLAIAIWDELL
jgi:chorismate synthase